MHNLRVSIKNLSVVRSNIKFTTRQCSTTSKPTPNEAKIEIPNYLKRKPADIFKALASTVGNDPTAPHYKYHDDPFLIPMSNVGKRTFAMAQEAGRKSAKWIFQEHQNLFQVRM
jgi:pentatricopeptide repeat domain-containing protein 3